MTAVSYILGPCSREEDVVRTLHALEALHRDVPTSIEAAEVIVAEDGSAPSLQDRLPSTELAVRVVRAQPGLGSAACNHAAAHATHDWLVLLGETGEPMDLGFVHALGRADERIAVVMANVTGADGSRRAGGLPEVFQGCGAAIRKQAFESAGGYDAGLCEGVAETSLSARLIAAGWNMEMSPWFRVRRREPSTTPCPDHALHRLTRDGGLLIERLAPEHDRRAVRREHLRRCATRAAATNARRGFARGCAEVRAGRRSVVRQPLEAEHFDRLIGLHHARHAVQRALHEHPFATACLTHEGEHAWVVRRALLEAGVEIIDSPLHADRLVIATMSTGAMLDALAEMHASGMGYRTLAPWIEAPRLLGLEANAIPLMPSLLSPAAEPAPAGEAPARTPMPASRAG